MFSMKIKEIRESKRLNQETVAEAIGVKKNTYLAYEKGTSSPQLTTIEKLAKFYGVNVAYLIDEPELHLHEKTKAKLALIEQLDEDEQKTLLDVMEAMVLRSQQRKIKAQFE